MACIYHERTSKQMSSRVAADDDDDDDETAAADESLLLARAVETVPLSDRSRRDLLRLLQAYSPGALQATAYPNIEEAGEKKHIVPRTTAGGGAVAAAASALPEGGVAAPATAVAAGDEMVRLTRGVAYRFSLHADSGVLLSVNDLAAGLSIYVLRNTVKEV